MYLFWVSILVPVLIDPLSPCNITDSSPSASNHIKEHHVHWFHSELHLPDDHHIKLHNISTILLFMFSSFFLTYMCIYIVTCLFPSFSLFFLSFTSSSLWSPSALSNTIMQVLGMQFLPRRPIGRSLLKSLARYAPSHIAPSLFLLLPPPSPLTSRLLICQTRTTHIISGSSLSGCPRPEILWMSTRREPLLSLGKKLLLSSLLSALCPSFVFYIYPFLHPPSLPYILANY